MPDFRFLSSTSVLASHYSASVSSFPISSRSRLTVASPVSDSAFASSVSPVLPSPVSRAFLPGSSYSASCSFPFALPRFAPTAVPRVLAFCFRFRPFPFRPCFLSSAGLPVLTTQPSVLPFPSSCSRLAVASPVLRFFLSASLFSTFSAARFPVPPFRFLVLGFLFVSFHPSRLRSHSCSTGASLLFRFLSSASDPGFSACFPHSFVRFSLLLTTQPPALSFPFFPFPLAAVPSVLVFPLPSGLFPCLPSDSGTQLPAVPFSVRCLASQWLPQRLSLLPLGFRPLPLGFRFRFWLLGFEISPFGFLSAASSFALV